jgi:hypothetical protein
MLSEWLSDYTEGNSKGNAVKALNKALSDAGLSSWTKYKKRTTSDAIADADNFVAENKWNLIADMTGFSTDKDSQTRAIGGHGPRVIAEYLANKMTKSLPKDGNTIDGWLKDFTDWHTLMNDLSDGMEDHAIIKTIDAAMMEKDMAVSALQSELLVFEKELGERVGIPPINLHRKMETIDGVDKKMSWDKLLHHFAHTRGRIGKNTKGEYSYIPTRDMFMSDMEHSHHDNTVFENITKRTQELYDNNKEFKQSMDYHDGMYKWFEPRIAEAYEVLTGKKFVKRENYASSLRMGQTFIDPAVVAQSLAKPNVATSRTGKGVTQEARVDAIRKGQPLLSYGTAMSQYRDAAVVYIGAHPHIMKMEMLIKDAQVMESFEVAGKAGKRKLLQEMIERERFVRGRKDQLTNNEAILRRYMTRFRFASLAGKSVTGALQPFSAFAVAGRLPGGFFGFKHAYVAAKAGVGALIDSATGNFNAEGSEVYRTMLRHNSRALHSEATHYQSDMENTGGSGWRNYQVKIGKGRQTIAQLGMLPIKNGDKVGRFGAWWAAYSYQKNNLTKKGWSEPDADKAAARFAEEEVSATQPAGIVTDRVLAQTGNEYLRSVIPFTGFWMKLNSQMRTDFYRPFKRAVKDSMVDGKFDGMRLMNNLGKVMLTGNAKEFGANTSMVKKAFWTIGVPTMAIGLLRRNRPPKDEKEFWSDFLVYTWMSVPIIGPIVTNHMAYPDTDTSPTFFAMIDDAVEMAGSTFDDIKNGKPSWDSTEQFIENGKHLGIPVAILKLFTKLPEFKDTDDSTMKNLADYLMAGQFGRLDSAETRAEAWENLWEAVTPD